MGLSQVWRECQHQKAPWAESSRYLATTHLFSVQTPAHEWSRWGVRREIKKELGRKGKGHWWGQAENHGPRGTLCPGCSPVHAPVCIGEIQGNLNLQRTLPALFCSQSTSLHQALFMLQCRSSLILFWKPCLPNHQMVLIGMLRWPACWESEGSIYVWSKSCQSYGYLTSKWRNPVSVSIPLPKWKNSAFLSASWVGFKSSKALISWGGAT